MTYYHTKLEDPTICDARFDPTSEICMCHVVLLMIRN